MAKADEEALGDLPDGSDGEDAAAATSAAKKKKRAKKKGGKGTEESQEAAEAAKAAPEAEPEAPAAAEEPVGAEGEESEEEGAGGEAGAAAKKKRKKPKKKGAAAAAATSEVAETSAAAPDQAGPESGGEEDAAAAESGEEEPQDAAGGPAKKKKKKPKKKGGAGAAAGAAGAAAQRTTAHVLFSSEEAFADWTRKALEATANESAQMSAEELRKPPQEFWGFKFSGDLRPAYVTRQMRMPEGWLMPDYALDSGGVSLSERQGPKEVPVLEGRDLEIMRQACRYGREVLDIASRFMRPGVTGDQIDRVVYQACVDRKIYPSPLNYYRFPKSVCVSPNEVICHGIPDCRPIEEGDIVNLDVSIFHEGFHSDLNETFLVGECDEESHRLVRTAYSALHAASQHIRPGTFYRDLGNIIHAEAAKNNCSVVTTYCGHGIGQLFHGPPKVPHYRKNKAVGIMKPGHVFTVEPMINLGSNFGDRTWPDNWTAVTKDGKRSAQFEHTFLVTETGLEVLTARHGTDRTEMPQYDPAMFQL